MIDKLNPNNTSHLMIWLVLVLVGGSAGTGILPIGSHAATAEDIETQTKAIEKLDERVDQVEKNDEKILSALETMHAAQHAQVTNYYDAEIMQLDLKADKTDADRAVLENLKRKREAHVSSGSQ